MDVLKFFDSNSVQTNLNAVNWHKNSGAAAIYPPLSKEDLVFLESQLAQPLPDFYKRFLLQTNGLFIRKLSLYGLPIKNSNKLDRSRLRPHSILSANQSWRLKYKMANNQLMVGSKSGWAENTGIFLSKDGTVTATDSQGTTELESFESLFDWSQNA